MNDVSQQQTLCVSKSRQHTLNPSVSKTRHHARGNANPIRKRLSVTVLQFGFFPTIRVWLTITNNITDSKKNSTFADNIVRWMLVLNVMKINNINQIEID